MKKSLIILRGLPGAGKNTLAEALGIKAVCCADDYFMHGGKYMWSADGLGAAHSWCQRKCRRFMKKQVEKIIIANTSVSGRDLVPYTDLARQFGYTVYSLIVENRHDGVNTHNCPEEAIERMKNRLMNNIVL